MGEGIDILVKLIMFFLYWESLVYFGKNKEVSMFIEFVMMKVGLG